MQRPTVLLSLLFLFFLLPIRSQAQDKVEIFGGYSYARPELSVKGTILCPGPTCPVFTLNSVANASGWDASGTYRLSRRLGIAADVGGVYGSATAGNIYGGAKTDAHLYTYLFGPQVSLPGHISPFAHVLFGGAHESLSSSSSNSSVSAPPTTAGSFAAAAGGGVDIKLTPGVWLRPIQVEYLLTRFNSNTQSQPRIAAGVVLHF